MINMKGIKRILEKGKMVLLPLGLVSTITLSGCGRNVDRVLESASKEGIELIKYDSSIYDFDGYNAYKVNGGYNTHSSLDDYYFISESLTIDEFTKYVGEENVTWDDIKNTIKESNYDEKIKNSLLRGVNNLETRLPNVNLGILNYNLKNLNIEIVDQIGDSNNDSMEVRGIFEPYLQRVVILKSVIDTEDFDRVLIHEVLGHGMTNAICDDKCSTLDNVIILSDNRRLNIDEIYYNISEIGHSLDEAVAEMISVLGTGKRLQETLEEDSPYDVYIEQLLIYLNSANITLEEFINNGLEYLMIKMKNAGCTYPFNYIIDFDSRKLSLVEEDYLVYDTLVVDIQTEYLYEIASKKLENGEDRESVIEYINTCVDSVNKYIIPTEIDGQRGVVWSSFDMYEMIDFNELKENVKYKIK